MCTAVLYRDKEDKKMSEKKRKFTVIDVIIVLILAAAVVFGAYKLLPSVIHPSNMRHITFTVMLQQQDQNLADAINEGDRVTISYTEKDGGIVKSKRIEPATAMVFNSMDGVYMNETLDGKVDVYVTLEADVKANDLVMKAGGTPIKVGVELPIRGKGYASSGYVIETDD